MSDLLDRISKLLALADNAGTPEEADAAMAKAQFLCTQSQIELEVARLHQADKARRKTPIQKVVMLAPRDVTRGRRINNAAEMCSLFLAIAEANDIQCNIYHDSSGIIAFGFESDIEVCRGALRLACGADEGSMRCRHCCWPTQAC